MISQYRELFSYMLDYSKKLLFAFDFRAENFKVIELNNDTYDNIFDYNVFFKKIDALVFSFYSSPSPTRYDSPCWNKIPYGKS
ncbi:hypothetical protein H5410_041288 [Solanum commersonii]|uniref:Uncharacterized protein n=1 Tax=Solanum commersonii TaxID=4109 RepID=A0A9J5XV22_SOLCO|nr:hypothetical protein H5410_041288 [Solanum commersonii]